MENYCFEMNDIWLNHFLVLLFFSFRALEDWDYSPPCMADIFRCMGKASRYALSAIARYLRLRSE